MLAKHTLLLINIFPHTLRFFKQSSDLKFIDIIRVFISRYYLLRYLMKCHSFVLSKRCPCGLVGENVYKRLLILTPKRCRTLWLPRQIISLFFRLKCNFGPPILPNPQFWSMHFKIEIFDPLFFLNLQF